MIWWKYEKKYACPSCGGKHTQQRGTRRGSVRYQCQTCLKWFSFNRRESALNSSLLLIQHLDGTSFRSLANQYNISVGTAYSAVMKELEKLPHCADVTRRYCNRFCGILLVDGKYIKVKGYERKIPVLYGIDYLTHDIPTYIFSVAENYQTCISYFQSLKLLLYPLTAVVCDDNQNIYQAADHTYPDCCIQLCLNHYKETIRQALCVRTDSTYIRFMKSIEFLFEKRRSGKEFLHIASKISHQFGSDARSMSILLDIQRRLSYLTGYMKQKRILMTTNLIESYNSHLQGRLKTIKGFESFKHADLWLNGYFLRRRMKEFTDCEGRFKRLNGTTSFSQTKKLDVDLTISLFKKRARF